MKSVRLLSLPGLVLLVCACAPAPVEPVEVDTTEADMAAINGLRDDFVAVHNTGDAGGVAAFYAGTAVLMPPNETAVIGTEAIASWFQTAFDQFKAELTLSAEDVQLAGDRAIERGSYTITLTPESGDAIEDNGKYIVVLARQADGSWKLTHDIWNSDRPLPGM